MRRTVSKRGRSLEARSVSHIHTVATEIIHDWKAAIECCECKKSKYRQSLMSIAVMYGSQ